MSGCIDGIEMGDGFLFVSGWAVGPDRGWPAAKVALSLSNGGVCEVTTPYARPDVEVAGHGTGPCAFLVDIPFPEQGRADARLQLLAGAQILSEVQLKSGHLSVFRPRAAVEEISSSRLTGWAFDPALWLDGAAMPACAELRLSDGVCLHLPLSVSRDEMAFAGGRALGFDLGSRELMRLLTASGKSLMTLDGPEPAALLVRGVIVPGAVPTRSPSPAPADTNPGEPDGFIDFFGHCAGLGGWLLGGWVGTVALTTASSASAALLFEGGPVMGEALVDWYDRSDVKGFGIGFVAYLPGPRADGGLKGFELEIGRWRRLAFSSGVRPAPEAELCRTVQAVIGLANSTSAILPLLARPVFEGHDTLGELPTPLHLEIDHVFIAPGAGIALIGWVVDPQGCIESLRVVGPGWSAAIMPERRMSQPRPDIQEALGARYGLVGDCHGFLAFAPSALAGPPGLGDVLYVEVKTWGGQLAFKSLPVPVAASIAAMRILLGQQRLMPDEVAPCCAMVLAPPVIALNRARLAAAPSPTVIEFGDLPAAPRYSVIIPLFGRIDWMSYQCALFSEHGLPGTELIYVLDDPPRKAGAIALALSCWRRFGLPIRLVTMPVNLGYAPANNAGLAEACGEYVCFLNSDVLPTAPGWLDMMSDALRGDPALGIVGGMLIFEDGTVQHAGMSFRRLPELGDFPFPMHPGKGRQRLPGTGLRQVDAVTGACMVMTRQLAMELGGFDTDYVIGDFEDADLCMRARSRGLGCAVHDGAVLWHLERQSQGSTGDAWRQNLTLVNAYSFAQRWGALFPDAAPASTGAARMRLT